MSLYDMIWASKHHKARRLRFLHRHGTRRAWARLLKKQRRHERRVRVAAARTVGR